MSEVVPSGPAGEAASGELQLDRAEFAEGAQAPRCAACHQALAGSYYEVDGHTVCAGCRQRLLDAYERPPAPGALPRAALAGLGAAAVGAGIHIAVRYAAGYPVGLISILVGFLVGRAVSWGSRGRGGWPYQALAMLLTYLAIVSIYVPILYRLEVEQGHHLLAAGAGIAAGVVDAARLLVAAAAVPFTGGVRVVGLIIIGVGLYEAWKLNRRPLLRVSGPHALGDAAGGFAGVPAAPGAGLPASSPPPAFGAGLPAAGPPPPAFGPGLPAAGPPPAFGPRLPATGPQGAFGSGLPESGAATPHGGYGSVTDADSAAPIRPR